MRASILHDEYKKRAAKLKHRNVLVRAQLAAGAEWNPDARPAGAQSHYALVDHLQSAIDQLIDEDLARDRRAIIEDDLLCNGALETREETALRLMIEARVCDGPNQLRRRKERDKTAERRPGRLIAWYREQIEFRRRVLDDPRHVWMPNWRERFEYEVEVLQAKLRALVG